MTKNKETPAVALSNVKRRIQLEGAAAAVEALITVCRDTKAPAPARATAGTTLLRAAGFFQKMEDVFEKKPHEMTAAEISEAIERFKNERR